MLSDLDRNYASDSAGKPPQISRSNSNRHVSCKQIFFFKFQTLRDSIKKMLNEEEEGCFFPIDVIAIAVLSVSTVVMSLEDRCSD